MLIKNVPSSLTFSHGCIRLRLRDPDQYDPEFITYLLKTGSFRQVIASLAKGSSTKNLSLSTLKKYGFLVPDIHRQRQIAAALRAYDSRIEENERQLRDLRAKASQGYQQWFTQHRIPEDCPAVPLGELLELHFDTKPAGTEPGDIPLYSSSGILRYVDTPTLRGEHILIPRKGNMQNIRLADGVFCTNDTVWYGIPRKPGTAMYLCHFLQSYGVEKLATGTRKPQITKRRLKRVMVPLPGADLLAQFENAAAEFCRAIAKLVADNQALAHERDALIETQLGRYSHRTF
jgi:restriction endonuclease S subunit